MEDDEYISVSSSPTKKYLNPSEEQSSSPQSSGFKPKMSKISPRRLSLSLAESFNQLEIPFKPKWKASAPVVSSFDEKEIDAMKLDLVKREVRYVLKTSLHVSPCHLPVISLG